MFYVNFFLVVWFVKVVLFLYDWFFFWYEEDFESGGREGWKVELCVLVVFEI